MKDINKKLKEIIDKGISGDLLIFCISISLLLIGMLGLETNLSQILTLVTKITGIVLCFLGAIIFIAIKINKQIANPFTLAYVILLILGIGLVYIANSIDISKHLSYIFIIFGSIGFTKILFRTVLYLLTDPKKPISFKPLETSRYLILIFNAIIAIALCTFFTWVVISSSHDLLQLNHNIKESSISSYTEDTIAYTINQTKNITENNKKEDSILANKGIKATQNNLTNNLERNCTEDSIIGIITKGSTPSTIDKNKNIVDWLTVFNSSIQNLLGLIMFILGAASLYYVSKQLNDSKKSREGDAFMQTFTTLLAQQHAILMKDTLTDKAFLDDNNHCPNAFSGFVVYFDEHQNGTELSEIWKGYRNTLRDPASFDCCFKYFYHMIEIILANESVLYNPQKEKFYLKLIQAELNHDILFCYLVNLLVHFQENPYAIDDLRRYRKFSSESLGNKKLIDIDNNHKLQNLDNKIFKHLEFNKDNLNQYFTENIINQYKEVNHTDSFRTTRNVVIKEILNQNKNKKLKDIFSKRVINKIKKKYFYEIFPDENPENNRTNKCELKEDEYTILAQYHFFNDLRLDVDFIERIWKIANIGFDRIKTPNNGTETNTPCSDRFLEVSYTGTVLNILFDKDENRLVVCVEDNKEIGYNYFRGYSSSLICPHVILHKLNLNINYNEVNPIDYIRISRNKTIIINGIRIDKKQKIIIDKVLEERLNNKYPNIKFSIGKNVLEIKNTAQNNYIQNSTKNRYVRNLRLLTGFYIKKENENNNKKWLLYGIDRYEEAVQNIL